MHCQHSSTLLHLWVAHVWNICTALNEHQIHTVVRAQRAVLEQAGAAKLTKYGAHDKRGERHYFSCSYYCQICTYNQAEAAAANSLWRFASTWLAPVAVSPCMFKICSTSCMTQHAQTFDCSLTDTTQTRVIAILEQGFDGVKVVDEGSRSLLLYV